MREKIVDLLCWGSLESDSRDTASCVVVIRISNENPMFIGRLVKEYGERGLEGVNIISRVGRGRIKPGFSVHINYTPDQPTNKCLIRRVK